ncbi:hypothetical protein [uncultured Mailhella sp.]|uniref:hypothetical protein n=1 Tax=uncultured Mailhella sp. TaxID=1981031 RepID=UPI0032082A1F
MDIIMAKDGGPQQVCGEKTDSFEIKNSDGMVIPQLDGAVNEVQFCVIFLLSCE